jgi:hypothetical protein
MDASWRDAAADFFPEFLMNLELTENPMQCWIDLRIAFERAYAEPRSEDLIERICGFAEWCLQQGHREPQAGEHLPTCVVVAFYPHIPALPAARADMPRRFTEEEVVLMQPVFTSHASPSEYAELLALYRDDRRSRKQERKERRKRPDRPPITANPAPDRRR